MTKAKINYKLVIAIFISIAVLAITSISLRKFHRNHRASTGLHKGNEAYEEHNWHEAAEHLGEYIAVVPNDVDILIRYAQAQLNRRPMNAQYINQAVNAYRRVLRIDPTQSKAAGNLIDIYNYLIENPYEAELIANKYLKHKEDPKIDRMLVISYFKQRKYDLARSKLSDLISKDSSDVESYALLAHFARQRPQDFKYIPVDIYNEAIRNNPSSAAAYISRGEYFLSENKIDRASKDLEKALDCAPKQNPLRLRLASGLIAIKETDKARQVLEQVFQSDPDEPLLWHIWASLALQRNSKEEMLEVAGKGCKYLKNDLMSFLPAAAELYIFAEDFENAKKVITQIKQQQNSAGTVAYMEGLIASKQKDTSRAIKLWKAALDYGLDSEKIHISLATAMIENGDSKSAIDLLQRFISKNKNNRSASQMLAGLLISNVQEIVSRKTNPAYNEALAKLKKAIELDCNNPRPWAIAAEINYAKADYTTAIDYITRGLTYSPDSKLLLLSKARTEAISSVERSIETLTYLRRNYPDDADVGVYLSYMYIAAGQTDNALSLLEELESRVSSDSDTKKVKLAKAEALFAHGEKQASDMLIAEMYEKYPDDPVTLLTDIRICRSSNNWSAITNTVANWYEKYPNDPTIVIALAQDIVDFQNPSSVECAENILQKVLEKDYANVDALNTLAIIYHVTGQSSTALKYYEKVLMIDPERTTAINNMAWILCEDLGQYDQALELTGRGLSQNPDFADLLDTRGVALYRVGKYEDSVKEFKRSIELYNVNSPGLAGAYFHLGRSLEKTGQPNQAYTNLQKAIEINKRYGGLSVADYNELNQLLTKILKGN